MGPAGLSSVQSLSTSTFSSKVDHKTVLKTNLTIPFVKLQKYYIIKKGNYISTLKKVLQLKCSPQWLILLMKYKNQ